MPFAAVRRHQFWSVDVRYIEDHQLGTGKPAYVISILENFSRALLASAISPRQDLTAYLIVLRAAVEIHGAPEALVSDGGSIFKAKHARAIYAALGIRKEQIEQGQPWQNYVEANFNVMRRMADFHYGRAGSWPELQAVHDRFFADERPLRHRQHARLLLRQVGGERRPVLRRIDDEVRFGHTGRDRRRAQGVEDQGLEVVGGDVEHGLALVRGHRGDVDEADRVLDLGADVGDHQCGGSATSTASRLSRFRAARTAVLLARSTALAEQRSQRDIRP